MPVYKQMDEIAIQPFLKEQIDQDAALKLAQAPVREFMFKQPAKRYPVVFGSGQ